MMKEGLTARIRTASYPVPAIFELIQKSGDIPVRDMYNTFNMGIGLVIAIPKDQVGHALDVLARAGRAVLRHRRRDQGRRRRGAGLRAGRMVRIAVLVSGGGTNLQALIDAQSRGELKNGRIAAVLSSRPDAYALERAARAGIPGYVVARKDFASNREMTIALVDKLRELNIGLVVLAGFLHILTGEMVAAFPNAILNVHPALIPSFCGAGYYGLHVQRGRPGLRREAHRRYRPLRQ